MLYSGGAAQSFAYDRHDNLSERRTAAGRRSIYEFDEHHRLRSATGSAGERVTFDYGPRASRFATPACTTEVDFDEHHQPVQVRQIIGGVVFRTGYRYDGEGHCIAILPPGSRQWLLYERNDTNATLQIRAEDGERYAALSPHEVRFANGICQRERSDDQRRIERITAVDAGGQPVMDLSYRFDDRWLIGGINDTQFAYDDDGRLTEVVEGSRDHTRYAYDARGNRLTEQSGAGAASHVYDDRDRLLQTTRPDGSRVDYGYDEDGHRVAMDEGGRRHAYRHDGEGRLISVWRDDACVAEYAYDAIGRRTRKTVAGIVTIFHYDQNGQLIAETDAGGRALATYLWIGMRCLGCIKGAVGDAAAEFYHNDHLGSVVVVTDHAGLIASRHDVDVFGRRAGPFFLRKRRDEETGFYDFGARVYDPESGRFLTPDDYTGGPDDRRLMLDPERDFWGERKTERDVVRQWQQHPHVRNLYVFCLNDPVNNIDLDGHSAWWFFLTIPSSLTWALPNTAIALLIIVGNLLMEIIGWVVWLVICIGKKEFAKKHYPWGNKSAANAVNPFDPNDRSHLWFGLDASRRLGVPWALLNGSFFVWRPYTLGNVIFIDDPDDNGREADKQSRYVVPKDPDVQLNAQEALHAHEMQHVLQYAILGGFFHSLPIPPLLRLIGDGDKWWQRIDLGGLTWSVGRLIQFASRGLIKADNVEKFVNPAIWWNGLLPFKWVKLVSKAWDLNNWLPVVGVYEWDSKFFFDQNNSSLERNAGANSGDVYQTVVEADRTEIHVGEFTRVIGADAVPQATPTSTPTSRVAFSISPAPNVGPAPAVLDPSLLPHRINLDAVNTAPVKVVNASAFYFQSLTADTFKVTGTGSQTSAKETVSIKVKEVGVQVKTDTFVCQEQTIRVTDGDSNATYTIRLKTNNTGATVTDPTYTAGPAAGTDTIEVVAKYDAAKGVFAKYGDNGLATPEYIVKTIDIIVKEPDIKLDVNEVFVGGIVKFTIDHLPQSGASTANVPGSQFNLDKKQFIAGKGPIAADTVETVTLDYTCRQFPFTITVKPIIATVSPPAVDGGGTAQVNVTGGVAPLKFEVSDAQSTGPKVTNTGAYTAGSGLTAMVDTITITDRNGDGGRARVQVSVNPMTVTANPAAIGVSATSTIVVASGVTPIRFEITHRESTGSTINNSGEYHSGTDPGADTITVTDAKGTRLTVTVTVT